MSITPWACLKYNYTSIVYLYYCTNFYCRNYYLQQLSFLVHEDKYSCGSGELDLLTDTCFHINFPNCTLYFCQKDIFEKNISTCTVNHLYAKLWIPYYLYFLSIRVWTHVACCPSPISTLFFIPDSKIRALREPYTFQKLLQMFWQYICITGNQRQPPDDIHFSLNKNISYQ